MVNENCANTYIEWQLIWFDLYFMGIGQTNVNKLKKKKTYLPLGGDEW